MWFEYPAGIRCVLRALHLLQTRPTVAVGSLFEGTCLVCASFSRSILENADSARRCRFRNSQQQRASDLDPTNAWIPKLDVAGLGCGTCRLTGGQPAILHTPMESGFRQRRYALTVCRANGVERRSLCSSECWMNLGSAHATVYLKQTRT